MKVGFATVGTIGVNCEAEDAFPQRVNTLITPVVAPIGTLTDMEVAVELRMVAFFPPLNMTESRTENPTPLKVTVAWFTFPVFGEIDEIPGRGKTEAVVVVLLLWQPNPSTHATK